MKCQYYKDMDLCYSKGDGDYCRMYKKTDFQCNIIKPKPKVKRIKACAYIFEDGSIRAVTYGLGNTHYDIPCTILINAKHIKGRKP